MKTTEEKSIKNSETTIQLITSLYCEGSPKESSNCRSKKCIDTQCLCMDTEQLGLLLSRMFDDREWRPADFSDNAFVHVLTNEEENQVRCHEQSPSDSEIRLIKCSESKTQYKKVKETLKKAAPQKIRSLLKMLPIIKMTNAEHTFHKRNSFIYICTFGDCAASFVERFMAMMIRYIVDQYISDKEISPILKKMECFFNLLLRVNTTRAYSDCAKDLIEQIDGYYNSMSISKKEEGFSCADYMWDFRKMIEESKITHKETADIVTLLYPDDEVEFVHLCHLLKTILDIIAVDYTFTVGNLQTYMDKQSEYSHDFYDKLESILLSERDSDVVRKKHVFSMLKTLLDKYGDWADEDLCLLEYG